MVYWNSFGINDAIRSKIYRFIRSKSKTDKENANRMIERTCVDLVHRW